MRRWNLSRAALSSCVTAALLAGCAVLRQAQDDTQPPIAAPGSSGQMSRTDRIAHRPPTTSSFQVLHEFGSEVKIKRPSHRGANPVAGLLDVDGTLYGTTYHGGHGNNGVVYSISTLGIACRTVAESFIALLRQVRTTWCTRSEVPETVMGQAGR
ncbi:MAG: choice-of-anchor tandem repeat GloVer-containing protein [Candidatus Cybelea sp.]